jgi:hypothetical protein
MPNIIKSRDQLNRLNVESFDTTTGGPLAPTPVYAERMATSIVGSNGFEAVVNPDTTLRVTAEAHTLFQDQFDTLDTTARWTLKTATGTATVSNGALNISSSTTASAYGGLSTKAGFFSQGLNILIWGATVRLNVAAITNTYRFFGLGTVPATPTVTVPVTDGYGFEIDGTGNFSAVTYRAGVKIFASPIPLALRPADNTFGRYVIRQRPDGIFFFVNDLNNPAAFANFPELNVGTFPAYFISVNAATPPSQAATMTVGGFGIGDSGGNNVQLSDGVNPWLKTSVKDTTVEATATENALVIRERLPVDPIQYTGILTTNTPAAVAAAGAAGIRNYCQSLSFQNTSVTATTILLQDGGTTIAQWNAPVSMGLPYTHRFVPPIRTTAATALNIQCGTTGANVLVNVNGFRA